MSNSAALRELAQRIFQREVVFFVGAGCSIDSEGNTAYRLMMRLVIRFLAIIDFLEQDTNFEMKLKENVDIRALCDQFEKTFDFREGNMQSFRVNEINCKANEEFFESVNQLKDNVWKLSIKYYEANDWFCSTYQRLLVVLNATIPPVAHKKNGNESTLSTKRRRAKIDQISQLEERKAQLGNQIDGLHAIIASRRKQTATLEKELSGLRSLLVNGYTSENRVLNVERQVEELLGQTAQNETEISRIRNTISETGLQIAQIQKEFNQQVFEEIREVDLQLNDLRQQLIATKGQLGRVEIIAPISGTVHELSIFTKGGCLLYTSPSPRDATLSRMPSSA